jgi:membrane protein
MILAMAILYYFALDVEQEWRWITPGSLWAVIDWLAASVGFAYHANN